MNSFVHSLRIRRYDPDHDELRDVGLLPLAWLARIVALEIAVVPAARADDHPSITVRIRCE